MRILLLCCTGIPSGGFYHDYLPGIEAAAAELGHVTRRFFYERMGEAPPAEREALYRLLADFPADVVIDPCCWGCALSQMKVWDGSDGGEAVFDSFDAAYIGLLCDQPYHQPIAGIQSRRLRLAVPDRTHGEQIAMIQPALAAVPTPFVPPAARIENDRSSASPAAHASRDIDLLYLGNLQTAALARPWRGTPEEDRCEELADLALEQPDVPLHRHLAGLLRGGRIETTVENTVETAAPAEAASCTLWLQRVEYHLRARFRLDAVRAAVRSGLRMHLVGEGWDSLSWPDSVTLTRQVSYEGFFGLAARARAMLDASTYLNGANDRIFNCLVNRCLVVSNARGFLADAFGETGLRCYSMRSLEGLGDLIVGALSDPARLRDETEAARAETLRSHTWRQRLVTMLESTELD